MGKSEIVAVLDQTNIVLNSACDKSGMPIVDVEWVTGWHGRVEHQGIFVSTR